MSEWFRWRPSGHEGRLWPVLLLLILVVLVPTAVLTWLVGQAARNERLVVRQRLAETYRARLEQVGRAVDAEFTLRLERSDQLAGDSSDRDGIATLKELGLADGVVCYDARGRLLDPKTPAPPVRDSLEDLEPWTAAVRLEFQENQPQQAAERYQAIAAASEHPDVKARALQAAARCWNKAGDHAAAVELFLHVLYSPAAPHARDPQQRLVAADCGLRALELMNERFYPPWEIAPVRMRLLELIAVEQGGAPSSQRRFIGRRLVTLFPGEVELPWLAAEELAADYTARQAAPPAPGALQPTTLDEVWQIASPRQRVVLLFRESTLRRLVHSAASRTTPKDERVALLSPDVQDRPGQFLATAPSPSLPGWRLALAADGAPPWDAAAARQIAVYAWTAVLAIGAVAVATFGLACVIGRQHRLRRLQSDWLATVSHELKTPLASIHLLTEALMDDDRVDRAAYVRLISTEATRLTRLIERLLTLTRSGAATFDRKPARPEELAAAAVEALGERLRWPEVDFQQRMEPDLPPIHVDDDAVTAALVNLLENAWKFTPREKRITLAVTKEDCWVCFRVSDNGPGLSPRDARRVFDRFFQVDRRLSREHGGCGLGLSIVKQTIEAHGGTVSVESRLGHGASFIVRLPAPAAATRAFLDPILETADR